MSKRNRIHTGVFFHRDWSVLLLLALGLAGLLWAGCGKKGPPRPPKRPLPPVVQDLRYTLQGDVVELRWTLPGTAGGSAAAPTVVKVFRAALSGEDISCEKCPIRFKNIATIPVDETARKRSEPRSFSFTETVDSGYRYIYKVVAFDEYGIGDQESNIIKFDYPSN